MNDSSRVEWIRSLKVGDTVEDCSYDIVKIKDLRFLRRRNMPWWVAYILSYLPARLESIIHIVWHFRAPIVDASLVVTGEKFCSAYYCCDPVKLEE